MRLIIIQKKKMYLTRPFQWKSIAWLYILSIEAARALCVAAAYRQMFFFYFFFLRTPLIISDLPESYLL